MKEYIEKERRVVYRGDVCQALYDELIKVSAYAISSEYRRGVEDGMKRTLGVLAHRVKDIPAADVVEVRKGRWERVDYGNGLYNYHCSSCRHIPRENIRSNYCPNCGAKMDGGDNP